MDESRTTDRQPKSASRQMMDFSPRKNISYSMIAPHISQKERARREAAKRAEERRNAIRQQIIDQKKEALKRAALARAAREELDERQAAEARRQHHLEIERRREQERKRLAEEQARNLEYEESVKRTQAARRKAEEEAREREAEIAEKKRQYRALLKQQQDAEAHRRAMQRREEAARARASRFAEEKRIREEAAIRKAELKERLSAVRAKAAATPPAPVNTKAPALGPTSVVAGITGIRVESSRIEISQKLKEKRSAATKNRSAAPVRYVSGFPRRQPGDPVMIVAPGSRRKTSVAKNPITVEPPAPASESPAESEDFGLNSEKLGSVDDFEADLMNLEASDAIQDDAYLSSETSSYGDDDLDQAISSLDEDDELISEKVSANNSRYIYGGKSPFINTDKIEKRPLSAITRDLAAADEMPHKNIYARRVAATEKEKEVPTMVVDKAKSSGIPLVIAVILTVIIGAAVGTVAYLAFFQ